MLENDDPLNPLSYNFMDHLKVPDSWHPPIGEAPRVILAMADILSIFMDQWLWYAYLYSEIIGWWILSLLVVPIFLWVISVFRQCQP